MITETVERDGVTYDLILTGDPEHPFGVYIHNDQCFETEAKRDAYIQWWFEFTAPVRAKHEVA